VFYLANAGITSFSWPEDSPHFFRRGRSRSRVLKHAIYSEILLFQSLEFMLLFQSLEFMLYISLQILVNLINPVLTVEYEEQTSLDQSMCNQLYGIRPQKLRGQLSYFEGQILSCYY
jgi:hypothetical protein